MATELKIAGNFFVLYDTTEEVDIFRAARSDVRYYHKKDDKVDYFYFRSIYDNINVPIQFSNIIDERTGLAFESISALNEYLVINLGQESSSPSSGISQNYIFVRTKEDLPNAISSVIKLSDNTAYLFVSNVDLTGDRLVGGSNTTILGTSSETASITSTGLGSTTALLTTTKTTPIQNITFKDVGTALDIDGTGNTVALDWTAVNFNNVIRIGVIKNVDNFIYTKSAFLDSQGLSFDGTIGTVAINNSLLSGDAATADDIVRVESTANITRRFRIIYSSVIVSDPTTGINVESGVTIPNQSFILDTVNFGGGGTYLAGLDYTSNKALFTNTIGVENSREVSQYYMKGNTTVTSISGAGDTQKVLGTTTSLPITSKFTNTNNRATYTGAITKTFYVIATSTLSSGSGDEIGVYIAKNGTLLPESESYETTDAAGRLTNVTVQSIVELTTNDYIEIYVENASDGSDITVRDLNVIIR